MLLISVLLIIVYVDLFIINVEVNFYGIIFVICLVIYFRLYKIRMYNNKVKGDVIISFYVYINLLLCVVDFSGDLLLYDSVLCFI